MKIKPRKLYHDLEGNFVGLEAYCGECRIVSNYGRYETWCVCGKEPPKRCDSGSDSDGAEKPGFDTCDSQQAPETKS